MKGILPLLFLCATFYLAHGKFYRALDENDQSYESVPQQYHEDWDRFRAAMLSQLQQDLQNGKKGPVTILGEALLDTIILLLDDTPNVRSAEGQRRSDLSDLDFRDSSVIPRSETDSETVDNITVKLSNSASVPGKTLFRTEHDSNNSNEKCFVRQILDLISLLVTNVSDGDVRKSGQPPTGPKMIHLLVHELNENLESLSEIAILDTTLFKSFKLIRRFLRGVKLDLTSSYKESSEINAVVKFLSKIESMFDGYIEADREMTAVGSSSPAIRLLLNQVEDGLEELAEGVSVSNSSSEGLSSVRKFIAELRSTAEVLILGKWDKEFDGSPFTQVLTSIKRVLAEMIQEMKAFENEPGSFNYLIHGFLTSVHSRLVEILLVENPKKVLR